MPSGWYGELILYSGPNTDCPRLATVKDGGELGAHSLITITLPALLPGSGRECVVQEEEMRVHGSLRSEAYEFAIPIPVGGQGHDGRQKEKFEWRRARGDELRSLDESSRGWKLVRLSLSAEEEDDGKDQEIVAVWADASMFQASMTKAARFQFLGSGATGELGDLWTLMAAVTFLRVWQRKMQLTITTGTAAAVA
ncbi:hypothetical protein VTN00DRAFT_1650 [Thermoascus crustaceus]|uniref:uncharacterized protein n=1 Tax=Thermoascus crustaceus TaxID=5088 RepID=UPI0037444F2B